MLFTFYFVLFSLFFPFLIYALPGFNPFSRTSKASSTSSKYFLPLPLLFSITNDQYPFQIDFQEFHSFLKSGDNKHLFKAYLTYVRTDLDILFAQLLLTWYHDKISNSKSRKKTKKTYPFTSSSAYPLTPRGLSPFYFACLNKFYSGKDLDCFFNTLPSKWRSIAKKNRPFIDHFLHPTKIIPESIQFSLIQHVHLLNEKQHSTPKEMKNDDFSSVTTGSSSTNLNSIKTNPTVFTPSIKRQSYTFPLSKPLKPEYRLGSSTAYLPITDSSSSFLHDIKHSKVTGKDRPIEQQSFSSLSPDKELDTTPSSSSTTIATTDLQETTTNTMVNKKNSNVLASFFPKLKYKETKQEIPNSNLPSHSTSWVYKVNHEELTKNEKKRASFIPSSSLLLKLQKKLTPIKKESLSTPNSNTDSQVVENTHDQSPQPLYLDETKQKVIEKEEKRIPNKKRQLLPFQSMFSQLVKRNEFGSSFSIASDADSMIIHDFSTTFNPAVAKEQPEDKKEKRSFVSIFSKLKKPSTSNPLTTPSPMLNPNTNTFEPQRFAIHNEDTEMNEFRMPPSSFSSASSSPTQPWYKKIIYPKVKEMYENKMKPQQPPPLINNNHHSILSAHAYTTPSFSSKLKGFFQSKKTQKEVNSISSPWLNVTFLNNKNAFQLSYLPWIPFHLLFPLDSDTSIESPLVELGKMNSNIHLSSKERWPWFFFKVFETYEILSVHHALTSYVPFPFTTTTTTTTTTSSSSSSSSSGSGTILKPKSRKKNLIYFSLQSSIFKDERYTISVHLNFQSPLNKASLPSTTSTTSTMMESAIRFLRFSLGQCYQTSIFNSTFPFLIAKENKEENEFLQPFYSTTMSPSLNFVVRLTQKVLDTIQWDTKVFEDKRWIPSFTLFEHQYTFLASSLQRIYQFIHDPTLFQHQSQQKGHVDFNAKQAQRNTKFGIDIHISFNGEFVFRFQPIFNIDVLRDSGSKGGSDSDSNTKQEETSPLKESLPSLIQFFQSLDSLIRVSYIKEVETLFNNRMDLLRLFDFEKYLQLVDFSQKS